MAGSTVTTSAALLDQVSLQDERAP